MENNPNKGSSLLGTGVCSSNEKKPLKPFFLDKDLLLRSFHSMEDEGWIEAWNLYVDAFPENERWAEEDYREALKQNPLFEAGGVWQGETFVGLVFFWYFEDACYIEHLAIREDLRGQSFGSRIMRGLINHFPCLILEIETPVDEVTRRRLRFYHHLGLKENPYEYIHPSYHQPFSPFPLVVMSYPEVLSQNVASEFARFVREEVLRYSEHEHPLLPWIDPE